MRLRILFLVPLLIATSAVASERWLSPDKFYSIIPPIGWKHSETKSSVGSSYAFTSSDGKAEIRISATYHLGLPKVLPDDVLELAFPKERRISPIDRVRGTGWNGLRREYTDADESTRWLGIAARRGSTAVLLTMRAPSKDFEHFRPIFESVSQSLQLGE
jgi:hypothetical protein